MALTASERATLELVAVDFERMVALRAAQAGAEARAQEEARRIKAARRAASTT